MWTNIVTKYKTSDRCTKSDKGLRCGEGHMPKPRAPWLVDGRKNYKLCKNGAKKKKYFVLLAENF